MSELANTILDTALTDVAATGVELRKVLGELEGTNDDTDGDSRMALGFKTLAATGKFVSAFGVFHCLAQGDDIPTVFFNDTPLMSDSTQVAETIIRAKRLATLTDLKTTLKDSYDLDEATANDKASDLSTRLSKCLDKTMKAVKTKIELRGPWPMEGSANLARLEWATNLETLIKKDQSWLKDFATEVSEGPLAFPTELADPFGLVAPDPVLRAFVEAARPRATSGSRDTT